MCECELHRTDAWLHTVVEPCDRPYTSPSQALVLRHPPGSNSQKDCVIYDPLTPTPSGNNPGTSSPLHATSLDSECGRINCIVSSVFALHPLFPFFPIFLSSPATTPSFHPAAPCVLGSGGQAGSERQGEQSALVMTACLTEYTFLSSPAPPPLTCIPSVSPRGSSPRLTPSALTLSPCDHTPILLTILFLFRFVLPSNYCHLPFLPCNLSLVLPSITSSSCPATLEGAEMARLGFIISLSEVDADSK
ncbi:unnamed protein product [Pleuronectes platessa]|uniref:Uncharacterized protein n=1 Tax=Pleuronectes platessa TaxID=8262 RepID=A0A9N7UEU3_PLEPL|nr:unnamed protein product [Pleuronectes platessa]